MYDAPDAFLREGPFKRATPSRQFFISMALLNLGSIEQWRILLPLMEDRSDWYDKYSYTVAEIRDEFRHQVAKYER